MVDMAMANQGEKIDEKSQAMVRIDQWVASSKSLHIAVFGMAGTGKSSLINTLLCEQVATEGDTLDVETKAIDSYTKTINLVKVVNGVRVTLWDTPGSLDPKCQLKEIDHIDLLVYCINFNQSRLGWGEVDYIQHIINAFGDEIWKRALFALTFGNMATLPLSNKTQSFREYFQSRKEEWRKALHQIVKKSVKFNYGEISGNIDDIPVVVTGYKDFPLPDDSYWFTDFWEACLKQVNFSTIPALICVTGDLVKGKAEHTVTDQVVKQRLKKIGIHDDGIAQKLEAEIFTDDSHKLRPQVAATIRQTDQGTSEEQFTRDVGTGIFLVAGIAILCILYRAYR